MRCRRRAPTGWSLARADEALLAKAPGAAEGTTTLAGPRPLRPSLRSSKFEFST